jgi:hypothetical protein
LYASVEDPVSRKWGYQAGRIHGRMAINMVSRI